MFFITFNILKAVEMLLHGELILYPSHRKQRANITYIYLTPSVKTIHQLMVWVSALAIVTFGRRSRGDVSVKQTNYHERSRIVHALPCKSVVTTE